MIKHIVLFQLKESLSAEEKQDIAFRFKTAIEALPAVIPTIQSIFVGINVNPDEKWDICLESVFRTLDEVKEYASHPAHLAAAALLKEVKQDRACTDYEC